MDKIDECDKAVEKDNKKVIIKEIYKILCYDRRLIHLYPEFKTVTIQKYNEFKLEYDNSDIIHEYFRFLLGKNFNEDLFEDLFVIQKTLLMDDNDIEIEIFL